MPFFLKSFIKFLLVSHMIENKKTLNYKLSIITTKCIRVI